MTSGRIGQNLKNQKSFPPYEFFLLINSAETACNNKNAPLTAQSAAIFLIPEHIGTIDRRIRLNLQHRIS